MAAGPAPRVMVEPGERVWPEMRYWDCGFGVMVSPSRVMGAGRGMRAEVVRDEEPAASVAVRMMAGRWVVEERMVPWALVEVRTMGTEAEMEAVERLVVGTGRPWALVEVRTMGWATAVLVEMVMRPFGSVEVTGTGIATGAVGTVVAGPGEGVMTMLVDAGAGGGATGGVSGGEASGGGVSVEEGVSAGGAFDVGVSAGAVFSGWATGCCVLDAGAGSGGGVGPASGSVDVEVFVRYNAVCNAAIGPTQSPDASQFQTPRPGKKFSIRSPVSPHVWSPIGTNVQPRGSSIVLTPVACTPSGSRGCDGKTATAPVGAIEHVGVPLTVVERVPVHVMFGA